MSHDQDNSKKIIAKEEHRRQKSKHKSKSYEEEAKTPPLPPIVGTVTNIDDLLMKRELLKEALKSLDGDNSRKHKENFKKGVDLKNNYEDQVNPRKRHLHGDFEVKNIKEIANTSSGIYENLNSDEEENIIEERRRQRKKLLEKLKHTTQAKVDNIPNESSLSKSVNIVGDNSSKEKTKESLKQATDMFSEMYETTSDNAIKKSSPLNSAHLADNWDDSEGYYNITTGDVINNRYKIKSILGQGMFSNVVQAQDNAQGNTNVAIKITRNNDLMYSNGLKEIEILKQINIADLENKYHCVKLLRYFTHKGHLCLVFESLNMDLRCVLKKYGRHHGLNMKALVSYSRQLLLALRLLKKVGIIHADIKPDNILVNEKKNILKLCDFGSAERINESEPKPYLVSRFYRAPEIILGLPYGHEIDVWSTACTIYELATGRIMFTGSSNNKMLKCFMDMKGKIPNKMIKKGKFKDQHFNYNNNFLLHKMDKVTGREKVEEITNFNLSRNLHEELKKSCKGVVPDEVKKLGQLKDLIDKMITINPEQRPSVSECLKHPLVQETVQK